MCAANVVKTRLQVQVAGAQQKAYRSTLDAVKSIWREEGARGFFKGFGTASLNLIVSQVYLSIFETLRSGSVPVLSSWSEEWRTPVAACTAVLVSQTISNPIDVVSQMLMVDRSNPAAPGRRAPGSALASLHRSVVAPTLARRSLSGAIASVPGSVARASSISSSARAGVDGGVSWWRGLAPVRVAMDVVAKDGIRGLFRGYWASMMQLAPASSLWWSSCGFYRKMMLGAMPGQQPSWKLRGVEMASGSLAGTTVAIIANPLDVLRTRVQVNGTALLPTLRTLVLVDGVKGLTAGIVARVATMAPNGALIITAYEFVKRLSLSDDARQKRETLRRLEQQQLGR
jgi:solute carrier family 25 protein 44